MTIPAPIPPGEETADPEVRFWNTGKPHRCPGCHAVAIDMERPSRWRIYTCCRCGTLFARWPRLAWLLPKAGIRCSEHRP